MGGEGRVEGEGRGWGDTGKNRYGMKGGRKGQTAGGEGAPSPALRQPAQPDYTRNISSPRPSGAAYQGDAREIPAAGRGGGLRGVARRGGRGKVGGSCARGCPARRVPGTSAVLVAALKHRNQVVAYLSRESVCQTVFQFDSHLAIQSIRQLVSQIFSQYVR